MDSDDLANVLIGLQICTKFQLVPHGVSQLAAKLLAEAPQMPLSLASQPPASPPTAARSGGDQKQPPPQAEAATAPLSQPQGSRYHRAAGPVPTKDWSAKRAADQALKAAK